ncbi:sphingomyelin synthase-related protein 1 isoform X3 [Dendropsophus ebraccatus]|uniref:sphingomyelin synthase-related protein 1 isoform X3 n=1 Tax=Dendropsophus ebraccatus TaxID=150705 RepID=UPI003831461C
MTPQVSAKTMSNSQLCIRRWTTKHVAKWLREEGFCDYVDILCNKHRLDGTALLALTEYDLRSPPLEIKVLGDIKRLMLSIRKLQKQHVSVLEELGLSNEPASGALSISSPPSPDWLCNGDLTRDLDGHATDSSVEPHQYSNGKNKHPPKRLDPEYWKTAISCIYVFIVFGFTSFVMVIVHERVPDMQTYPPLPDIFLDSVPRIPWAFAMTEMCGVVLCYIWLLVLLLHKHRSILLRRLCSLMGTVFLLRCVTMFVTSLSVPGEHLQCSGKTRLEAGTSYILFPGSSTCLASSSSWLLMNIIPLMSSLHFISPQDSSSITTLWPIHVHTNRADGLESGFPCSLSLNAM